jgi:acyl-CoA thioester hydrolase
MPLSHTTRLRVRFGETDAVGVANNAVYLQWFEIGRIELLRAAGHSYLDVHRDGLDMVVTEAGVRYLRPLVFDDEVEVETTLSELGRASFRFDYRLLVDGELRSTGFTRHACIHRGSMRPVRVPAWLHELAA